MADKTITCQDCDKDFVFTEEEQNYYAEKGFQDPKRCKSCRMARKRRNPKGGMGGDRRGGHRGPRGGGGYNR
ncbi:MAG: zinc-ribbon domain-containing protein [Gemmatimonadota bacterium]|nr:MAG: zinc-ribbon domain-containing protein [Gemmatimonadota bacterium]